MQGIEILNKTPVMVQPDWWNEGVLISIGLFIVFTVLTFIFGENEHTVLTWLSIILAFVSIISVAVCGNIKVKNEDGRYRYETIIDDGVSIQEVYENYNVIEKDGKKWILEDKEK